MEWWVWLIIVGVAVVGVLMFFEWRSWNKPLARGLEEGGDRWHGLVAPPDSHGDLKGPG